MMSIILRCYADTLSGTIVSDTLLAPGAHVVSGIVTVAPGVTLEFSPVSTVRFSTVSAGLIVAGTVRAAHTFFAGATDLQRWGQIYFMPGSTCVLASCHLDNGGSAQLPPLDTSNAVVYAESADVYVSNSIVTRPQGDCVAFRGGTITFVDNVVTSTAPGYGLYAGVALYGDVQSPVRWRSQGNRLPGSVKPGIWFDGTFARQVDLMAGSDEVVHFGRVVLSNAELVVAPGTIMSANNTMPGSMTFDAGGVLTCQGTLENPILWTNYYGANPWPGITWLPGSTGIISSTAITRALRHTLSNAYVALAAVRLPHLQDGFLMSDRSVLAGENVVFHGMINRGVSAISSSSVRLRNCQFVGNNAPFMTSLSADGTSVADVRFCWWNSSSGPRPFGSGDVVATNAGSVFFPWLLAVPGSQTNPPAVQITSPQEEPHVTSEAQVWLEGTARDDGAIARLEVQNAASPHRVLVMPDSEGVWRAQVWLYEGMNSLAVFAYDDEGNVAVDARLVECSGAGVGPGAATPPAMAPMQNRVVRVGELVRVRCIATSPDGCTLTYWADNTPPDSIFDQELRELRFIPQYGGVSYDISFYACDGRNVASTVMRVDVTQAADPPVSIRTATLPDGIRYQPYTCTLIADNAVGPVTWSYTDFKAQDGLTFSRAGVISGVPLQAGLVTFIAMARDTRGGAVASNTLSLRVIEKAPTNTLSIPFQQVPVCVSGVANTALATLQATNGHPAYAWFDASGVLDELGLALGSNGVVAGTAQRVGVFGWVPVARDQSNGTCAAQLAAPVIAPEHRLARIAGQTKGKVTINRVPGSQTKGNMTVKIRFTPPPGFTFDQTSPVVAQIGLTQITVPNAYKYKPGAQLVFKKVDGIKSYSISVKYKPGLIQASFALKKVNLTLEFEQYGIRNENVLVAQTANVPIWVRIGNYEMATELMPLVYTTKVNKSTKGKAAW